MVDGGELRKPAVEAVAPFRGRWQRGAEHESMLEMSCGQYAIRLTKPWAGGEAMEWWLVESLHLWPHPEAPVTPDECDYPAHRNREYARLKAATQKG